MTGYLESLLRDIGSVYGVSLRAGDHEMGYPIP